MFLFLRGRLENKLNITLSIHGWRRAANAEPRPKWYGPGFLAPPHSIVGLRGGHRSEKFRRVPEDIASFHVQSLPNRWKRPIYCLFFNDQRRGKTDDIL